MTTQIIMFTRTGVNVTLRWHAADARWRDLPRDFDVSRSCSTRTTKLSKTMRPFSTFALASVLALWTLTQAAAASRSSLLLEGKSARVVVDLRGGSIAEFRFSDSPLNPLRWATPDPGDPNPNVVSYTIDGPYGWVTAATPKHGLLIRYISTGSWPSCVARTLLEANEVIQITSQVRLSLQATQNRFLQLETDLVAAALTGDVCGKQPFDLQRNLQQVSAIWLVAV